MALVGFNEIMAIHRLNLFRNGFPFALFRRVRVNMKSYKLQGDSVAVEFDIAANRPLGIKISTYLQDPSQVVLLTAGMGQLADGTTFASNITLDAAAKNLRVNVLNSGHRKLP